jgi:NAD(P)-dependent dehydrogenase (short-subunit alcohol dehydrogenase family)
VNSINPGLVETEGLHPVGVAESDFRKHTNATTPLGRIAQPEDIAIAAVCRTIAGRPRIGPASQHAIECGDGNVVRPKTCRSSRD